MNTKALILKIASQKSFVQLRDILSRQKISRQTIAQHFRELIAAGKLVKMGSTRGARYFLPSKAKKREATFPSLHAFFRTRGLEEDRVFGEMNLRLQLKKRLSQNAWDITQYAFTEMLNNATEHSKSPRVRIQFLCDGIRMRFHVIDRGVGVFENVRKKFGLKNDFEACEHLLKGKQTTDPKHHTGQGIFFTSKIADVFVLESHGLRLRIDNEIPDIFLEEISPVQGTRVSFFLKQRSKKNLKKLFDDYSDANYEFDKTEVQVCLLKKEEMYVSRSEAKRLLFGLNVFKRIVIDFKNVRGIGQSFADEIFRVFQKQQPHIQIQPIHMNASVRHLVERARRETLQ